ncbi:MAG TPA: ribonuclease Z [Streptosporangiaceae bacterium]|nr:ribonuclease Z [Streptosporangiaceae bacterium]
MASRELVILGTASQAPTRERNHNGYLLRWDGEGLLFDPGEGTQRQMLLAGVRASEINRICVTHFHGDHCLGLPGVLQRISLDRVAHDVVCHYPAEGREYFDHLRHAAYFHDVATVREHAATGDPEVLAETVLTETGAWRLAARPLSHRVPTVGYQLAEPDGRRMRPDRLAALGISGPDVGRLARDGSLEAGGRRVTLDEVSEPRSGQRFAFIMDTRLCDSAFALAEGADLIVCETTFLDTDADLAPAYGHLTARQAGQIAAESGVRTLVLSHFSQRYAHQDPQRFADEAGAVFGGEIVIAADLARVPLPRRLSGRPGGPAKVTSSPPAACRSAWPPGAAPPVRRPTPLSRPSGRGPTMPNQRTG